MSHGVLGLGVYNKKLTDLHRRHGNTKSRNSSRCLHRLIHRKGLTLSVKIDTVNVKVRALRKRKVVEKPWPVLYLSSWIKLCFQQYAGFFVMGGRKTWGEAQLMFREFWQLHVQAGGEMPPYPDQTLPIFLHGDEGRGLGKKPLLVISYQPVVSWLGPYEVNSKGCLVCMCMAA